MIMLQFPVYSFPSSGGTKIENRYVSYKIEKQLGWDQKLLNAPGSLLNSVVDNLRPLQTIAVIFGVNALNEAWIHGCK